MDAVRTCLACRHKGDRNSLLRFVRADDGEICFDEKASLPNRGAWLCAKKDCLNKAFLKRLLFRKEKTLPVNAEEMRSLIAGRMKSGVLNRLGLLKRMGQCDAGRDAALRLVTNKEASTVIVASDFAERSLSELKARLNLPPICLIESPFTMIELGNCLGRPKTGVVALSKSRITEEIVLQVNKLSELGH